MKQGEDRYKVLTAYCLLLPCIPVRISDTLYRPSFSFSGLLYRPSPSGGLDTSAVSFYCERDLHYGLQ